MARSITWRSRSPRWTRCCGRASTCASTTCRSTSRAAAAPACQLAIEFTDPDGHNLEIYWDIDQVGSDGRVRPAEEWKGATSLEAAIADPVVGQDTTVQDRSLLRG